jgi:hypothetical protein
MNIFHTVKRIEAPDGRRFVEIEVRNGDDLFRFVETVIRCDADEGYEYWSPSFLSGLYPDAMSAERAARMELQWLRQAGPD